MDIFYFFQSNEDKASSLKKQNDELGYMFLPTQV